jgi:hypothetical protein
VERKGCATSRGTTQIFAHRDLGKPRRKKNLSIATLRAEMGREELWIHISEGSTTRAGLPISIWGSDWDQFSVRWKEESDPQFYIMDGCFQRFSAHIYVSRDVQESHHLLDLMWHISLCYVSMTIINLIKPRNMTETKVFIRRYWGGWSRNEHRKLRRVEAPYFE